MPYYIYDKKTTEVRMVSEKPIAYQSKKFDILYSDDEDFEGYQIKVKDGKIEKTPVQDSKEELKKKLDKAENIKELKEIIKDLIK